MHAFFNEDIYIPNSWPFAWKLEYGGYNDLLNWLPDHNEEKNQLKSIYIYPVAFICMIQLTYFPRFSINNILFSVESLSK